MSSTAIDPRLGDLAVGYAASIQSGLDREYPYGYRRQLGGPEDLVLPRQAHPAFYGCYDWHSAVEMHWALARMVRLVPDAFDSARAREVLGRHLTPANLAAETSVLAADPAFERPYGWGWALTLAAELAAWDDPDGREWAAAVRPLAEAISDGFVAWLPKLGRPLRHGLHPNTAFALRRALAWARATAAAGDPRLLDAITSHAHRFYGGDAGYPVAWEPEGHDFLSGALTEIDLMAQLLEADFPAWLAGFLPDGIGPLAVPVEPADRSDGQLAHLDGLNLYRAYGLRVLAARLASGDPLREAAEAASDRHADTALGHVVGGDWMGEHWLAAFAMLYLTEGPLRVGVSA